MQRAINIQNELLEMSSTLANVPYVATYTIDSNYFKSLPLFITAKINGHKTYSVPLNYFDTLSNNILNKINAENDELPAIFNSISKANVYQTPIGYFETNNVLPKIETPVVAIQKKSKLTWLKYAAAACVVSIITFTAVNIWNKKDNTTVNNNVVINGTSLTFGQIQQINVDNALDSLSSVEVDNYLCINGLVACNDDKKADESLQKSLEELNVNDDDLQKALEESF